LSNVASQEKLQSDFASVAEAVAHYYGLGFETVETGDRNVRTMRRGADPHSALHVAIRHVGLLHVTAEVTSSIDGYDRSRLEQVRRAHALARPNTIENPAFAHTHADLGIALERIRVLEDFLFELVEGWDAQVAHGELRKIRYERAELFVERARVLLKDTPR
jgi:hypothetical protein